MMGLLDPRLMAYLQQRGITPEMLAQRMQQGMPAQPRPQMPRPMQTGLAGQIPPQMQTGLAGQIPRPMPQMQAGLTGQMPNPLMPRPMPPQMPRPMPQQNYFGQQMFPAQIVRSDVPLAAARPGAVTRPYLPGMNPIMRGPVLR